MTESILYTTNQTFTGSDAIFRFLYYPPHTHTHTRVTLEEDCVPLLDVRCEVMGHQPSQIRVHDEASHMFTVQSFVNVLLQLSQLQWLEPAQRPLHQTGQRHRRQLPAPPRTRTHPEGVGGEVWDRTGQRSGYRTHWNPGREKQEPGTH